MRSNIRLLHLSIFWMSLTSIAAQAGLAIETEVIIPSKQNGGVSASVFTVNSKEFRISVLSTASLGNQDSGGPVRASVKDLPKYGSQVPARGESSLFVNGGFSGSLPDRPVGLLVSGGRMVSIPNYSKLAADPKNSCPHLRDERYRFSGLVCVKADRSVYVGKFGESQIENCMEAIQAGPLLVSEKVGNSICPQEAMQPAARRTAICADSNKDLNDVFRIVVTNQPVTLFELAAWLAAPVGQGGLGCTSAVNMSGDNSSGAVLVDGRSATKGSANVYGDGSYPQASVLSITGPTNAVFVENDTNDTASLKPQVLRSAANTAAVRQPAPISRETSTLPQRNSDRVAAKRESK